MRVIAEPDGFLSSLPLAASRNQIAFPLQGKADSFCEAASGRNEEATAARYGVLRDIRDKHPPLRTGVAFTLANIQKGDEGSKKIVCGDE